MTLAHREPIRLGPAPWHRHRGPWLDLRRPIVWADAHTGQLVHGRATVRRRSCSVCGRVDVRWPGRRRRRPR